MHFLNEIEKKTLKYTNEFIVLKKLMQSFFIVFHIYFHSSNLLKIW